ncbi:MAG: carbohydrate ABC transporter permease [Planctomycetota bacterium]|nr:carbohydrate ABC transporter permease [Planctomycetota bacterium]
MTAGAFKTDDGSRVAGGRGSRLRRLGLYSVLMLIATAFLLPLVWMIATSLKNSEQAASGAISLLADPPSSTLEQASRNYTAVWKDPSVRFPLYLRNSLVIALLSVGGMVVSSAIVAYAFARIRWRGRGAAFAVMLATMMIPFPVIMGPLFLIFSKIGWVGTLKPLWVPAWFGGAFNIFLLRQFYQTIPRELDEAARIDGCSHWGIFWRIIVPLSRPALAVVALFHFIYVWNDFLAPLIFLTHQDQFTLALGLQLYQGRAGNTPWNHLMAASTLVVAPVLVLFVLTQRTFVKGISAGGVKE